MKSKHIFINYLGTFKLMLIASKVSFSALIFSDTVIYIFLIGYDFDSMMSYSYCFVLTIGLLFVNIFISTFLTIVIEIPLRVLRKILYKDNKIIKSEIVDSLSPLL